MVPRHLASDPVTADLIAEAINLLAEHGPALGRPLVDRLHHSKYHNMKELRPPSTGCAVGLLGAPVGSPAVMA